MRFSALLAATLSLTPTALAAAHRRADPTDAGETSDPAVELQQPTRFILELADGVDIDQVQQEMASRRGVTVRKAFKTDVFTGLSIEAEADTLDSLQAIAPVERAWPSRKIRLWPMMPGANFSATASVGLAARDTVELVNPEAKTKGTVVDINDIHKLTGVDKLHAEGILGQGAIVAVVDTGVNYAHEALGGGFGPGFKVAKGTDFIGDGGWPSGGKEPDDDPMDTIGHGSHVAGIVAGDSSRNGFRGVAPKATIYAYKVFGGIEDWTDDEVLIEAFLAAYDDGVDVITCSIGESDGWPDGPWQRVADRVAEAGVVVVIACGNSGSEGPFVQSSGSSAKNVLAVASAEGSVMAGTPFNVTLALPGAAAETVTMGYITDNIFPTTVRNRTIVPLFAPGSTTELTRACNGDALPAGASLTNAVALIRFGGCPNFEKQINVQRLGAKFVLMYNDDSILQVPLMYDSGSLLGQISGAAGHMIMDVVSKGGRAAADFSLDSSAVVGIDNNFGGTPNDFTSLGGLADMSLKPDIAAPGGDIFSTFLEPFDWKTLSGTSMATPYVAGVAALYVGKHGGRRVHGAGFSSLLSMKIISSGNAMPWMEDNKPSERFSASVAQVGNGMVRADKVLGYTTSLSFARFALNDTAHFNARQAVDITNGGDEPVTYSFALHPAGGFNALAPFDPKAWPSPRLFVGLPPAVEMVPGVQMPEGFTLQPGETRTAEFIFSIPEGLNASALPVYSGKVGISSSKGEALSVPYFGMAADLSKEMNTIFEDNSLFARVGPFDGKRVSLAETPVVNFDLRPGVQNFPRVDFRLKWAAKSIRWDIFTPDWDESQWTYPPVVGQNNYVGPATVYRGSNGRSNFDPSRMDRLNTTTFPLSNFFRDTPFTIGASLWWLGTLGNGSMIAPGNYTMKFSSLAPLGDPALVENWRGLTLPITVQPAP